MVKKIKGVLHKCQSNLHFKLKDCSSASVFYNISPTNEKYKNSTTRDKQSQSTTFYNSLK